MKGGSTSSLLLTPSCSRPGLRPQPHAVPSLGDPEVTQNVAQRRTRGRGAVTRRRGVCRHPGGDACSSGDSDHRSCIESWGSRSSAGEREALRLYPPPPRILTPPPREGPCACLSPRPRFTRGPDRRPHIQQHPLPPVSGAPPGHPSGSVRARVSVCEFLFNWGSKKSVETGFLEASFTRIPQ